MGNRAGSSPVIRMSGGVKRERTGSLLAVEVDIAQGEGDCFVLRLSYILACQPGKNGWQEGFS